MLLAITGTGSLFLTLVALLIGSETIMVAGTCTLISLGFLIWLMGRGQSQLFAAQVGTVVTFWVAAAYIILMENGVRDLALLFYSPIFLFASITLNRLFFWLTAATSIVFVLLVGLAEQFGYFYTRYSVFPMEIDLYLILVVMAVATIFTDMFITAARRHIAAMEKAKLASEKADRTKTAFLNMMSHELRSPLNPIVGYSDLLKEDLANTEHRSYVEEIQKSSQLLLEMIENVLEYSQIADGTVPLQRVQTQLGELAGDLEYFGRRCTEGKQVEVRVSASLEAHSSQRVLLIDRQRVIQILEYLIKNAVLVTSQGVVPVELDVVDCKRGGIRLICVVSDSGPIIESADLEEIFKPFSRSAENIGARSQKGLGLGLAKCRQLALLMDGELRCESGTDFGARFIVDISAG